MVGFRTRVHAITKRRKVEKHCRYDGEKFGTCQSAWVQQAVRVFEWMVVPKLGSVYLN